MAESKKDSFTLNLLPDRLMVCRLPAGSKTPDWATNGNLWAVVRTAEELSIVCADFPTPVEVLVERGWRAMKVQGPLEFSMVGVLACLAQPLAQAGVSIFVLSTYDTDYLLIKEAALPKALVALRAAGHTVVEAGVNHLEVVAG